jgi:hypothetical protein
MDHAEAHERIADLALEPGRLAALVESSQPADVALSEHTQRCPDCRAELADWRSLQAVLVDVVGGREEAGLAPISAPSTLRASVLAAAHAEPREVSRQAQAARSGRTPRLALLGRPWRWPRPVLALAAALVIVVAGLGVWVAADQARINAAAQDRQNLTALANAMSRVMAAPDGRVVGLLDANGAVSGSIAWSSHDLVVTASSLSAPVAGQVYRCWLDYEGSRSLIGEMKVASGTYFWLGWTDAWAKVDLEPDAHFLVTLEDELAGDGPFGPVVLQAALGS